ncbi:unnamed protein product, partial [Effrenium voratum]
MRCARTHGPMAFEAEKAPVVCAWLRNDLRTHDSAVLSRAAELSEQLKLPVLVVYVLDEGQLRTGKFRAKFLLQSLAACKANLQLVGSDLLIRLGRPEEVLPRLLAEGSVLVTQEEPTFEEQATDRALQTGLAVAENMRWEYVWGATLIHKDDLPFQADLKDMPDVFTAFKNQVAPELKCACNQVPPDYRDAPKAETALNIRRCLAPLGFGSLPLPALDFGFLPCWSDLSFGESESEPELPFGIAGGESAGQRRLEEFMGSPMARYAESKNNMLALDASSKLSPWLANGSLSPRRVFEALRRREAEISADAATYWFTFALLVRDFFHFMAKKQGRRIFLEGGVIGKRLAWKGGDREFQLWQQGQTGFPLVDANMREMATTGWMSNRGRQNVASFLIWDLQVDWRRGADWFERCLLDYDVASNWCNWVAAAELTGGRVNRFNVVKQSRQYDPEGEYLRRWLPELRELPAEWIHEPWRREGSKLSAYPPPCVPLEALAQAKKLKSLSHIKAALEQAQEAGLSHMEMKPALDAQKEIKKQDEAMEKLEEAVDSREYEKLRWAIKWAKEAKVDEDEIADAEEVLQELERRRKAMEMLEAAREARSVAKLVEALKLAEPEFEEDELEVYEEALLEERQRLARTALEEAVQSRAKAALKEALRLAEEAEMDDSSEAADGHRVLAEEMVLEALRESATHMLRAAVEEAEEWAPDFAELPRAMKRLAFEDQRDVARAMLQSAKRSRDAPELALAI